MELQPLSVTRLFFLALGLGLTLFAALDLRKRFRAFLALSDDRQIEATWLSIVRFIWDLFSHAPLRIPGEDPRVHEAGALSVLLAFGAGIFIIACALFTKVN